ncbi:MAG TPA: hypothetical protein VGQ47_02490 [Candidatus Limnocylindrales bacterium]|nr:hypothetical protein [Candidatus Limnocylindrales bacterium]
MTFAPADVVVTRLRVRREPIAWFALQPADRPIAEPGQRLIAGDPLLERVRDPTVSEARLPESAQGLSPGEPVRRGEAIAGSGRRAIRFEAGGRVLYEAPRRHLRVAVGTHHEILYSPIAGFVEGITPGGIGVRCDGLGVSGVAAAGDPAGGRLVVAVPGPEAELRSTAIDVGAAGTVLVGGSRVDVEALTRARAMGVRGIVTGGLMAKDLKGFLQSEARQRAGLQPSSVFGVVVLDGYGRRPIPRPVWDALREAEGQEVGLVIDPPMLVLPPGVPIGRPRQTQVRVTAGDHVGRQARFVRYLGLRRQPGGLYQPSALIELEPTDPEGTPERAVVPLADLERWE